MRVQAVAARSAAVAISQSEAHSADLRRRSSRCGRTEQDAGRAIRLLQSTPLAPSFGAAFADFSGVGPVKGEIAMYLPIRYFEKRVVT